MKLKKKLALALLGAGIGLSSVGVQASWSCYDRYSRCLNNADNIGERLACEDNLYYCLGQPLP